jgi:hypothetical protein
MAPPNPRSRTATCNILKFSIRSKITMPAKHMAERLENILGCTFQQGYRHKEIPAWQASLLGMDVYLDEWRGVKDSRIYRLDGAPANRKYAAFYKREDTEFIVTDISSALIDLLAANNGGTWYVPSEMDIDAELAYGNRVGGG